MLSTVASVCCVGKSKTKKKSKKKTADLHSVSAALDQNGHAEENGDAEVHLDALANGAHPGPEDEEEALAFGKKKKKSSKSKRGMLLAGTSISNLR